MLIIRLQRAGKKNKPDFRIVLAEKESSASKKFTEILGHYNPRTKEFSVKSERVQYWMSQQATLSPTVHNLLVTKSIINSPKVKAFSIPAKPPEPPAAEGSAKAEAPAEPVAEATPVETPASPEKSTAETV